MEILYVQSPAIERYFSLLTGPSEGVSWTEESLPLLFDLSSRTRPYDIPFDKIRENLLNLDADLADMIVKLEIYVRSLNDWLTEDIEGSTSFSTQSKESYREMLNGLRLNKKVNTAIAEYVRLLAQASRNARRQLFAGKKKISFDWASVDKKLGEIDSMFLEVGGLRSNSA